jgi:hypothetical protein
MAPPVASPAPTTKMALFEPMVSASRTVARLSLAQFLLVWIKPEFPKSHSRPPQPPAQDRARVHFLT